ncbi:XdhC/CoxI family protein [Paenibacillus nanensis]|uniref:XdhC/CoxI family protein n=1 Tax=Paenibacillus nanensis TaxID=393251 RepID=A0A3A1UZD5_9BACL|nr:XdhC/CoxI family protein [Paenibacillus nanensis]RIX51723.1 XdhC/CoxI family protein [Paenibacillus nanensis]
MHDADLVKEAANLGGRCVIATILFVEGHAYRKKGAMMVLKPEGEACGTLSPGCLETDLLAYVPFVLQQNSPQLVEYDMRPENDLSWGEHIGCGGLIRVLLEPVTRTLLASVREASQILQDGKPVWFIRKLKEQGLPNDYAVTESRETAEAFREKGCETVCWEPKPRLLLFGAGDDARPLCQLAQGSGFSVTVTDFRESLCREDRFPGAFIVPGFPKDTIPVLRPSSKDYVVIMSHQFQRDRQFLELVLPAKPFYIGVMGSAARRERLLGDNARNERISCPIGLPIGADGPYEIAVSVMAELIAVRRGGDKHEDGGSRNLVFGGGKQPAHGISKAVG